MNFCICTLVIITMTFDTKKLNFICLLDKIIYSVHNCTIVHKCVCPDKASVDYVTDLCLSCAVSMSSHSLLYVTSSCRHATHCGHTFQQIFIQCLTPVWD